uniref:ATP-dependent DNA helicase n=1 Tax=Rhabditophanes sp. KR3021 TaxID=114890 RepID=A0AC35TYK3_9BILA
MDPSELELVRAQQKQLINKARASRTEEEIEIDLRTIAKEVNKACKANARASRTEEEVARDNEIDRIRKAQYYQNMDPSELELVRAQQKQLINKARASRTEEEIEIDRKKDNFRKKSKKDRDYEKELNKLFYYDDGTKHSTLCDLENLRAYSMALHDIDLMLTENNINYSETGLPPYDQSVVKTFILFELQKYRDEGQELYSKLNEEQKVFVADVIAASEDTSPTRQNAYFLKAPAGTGKTTCFRALYCILKGKGLKCQNVASTGKAATLLENGLTAHSIKDKNKISSDTSETKAIICGTNVKVNEYNKNIIDNYISGDASVYLSVDDFIEKDNIFGHTKNKDQLRYLHLQNPSGMPPHELKLKKGCIAMLLKNLCTSVGLCNGALLQVVNLGEEVLICRYVNGSRKDKIVLIPKTISRTPEADSTVVHFERVQFPVCLAYAMTVHKAQGGTFDKVGVDLTNEFFAHGQLYVALSRCTSADGLFIKLDTQTTGIRLHKVYQELLS